MYKYLERLTDLATAERYMDRVRRAKEIFFRATGNVFEEDSFYESRMNGFLEFYVFDYREAGGESTVSLVLDDHRADLSADEVEAFRGFEDGVHGVFEFLKRKKDQMILRDMYDRKKYGVTERRVLAGIDKGDIFEARLLPFGGQLFFSNAFVFHPREVRRFIVTTFKKERKADQPDPRSTVQRLAHLRLKFDRYRTMDARRIYSAEGSQLLDRAAVE